MLEALRFFITVLLIGIALSIIYPHGRWVWLNHPKYGYRRAIAMRWKLAKSPIVVGVFIILLALGIELYLGIKQDNESNYLRNQMQMIQQNIQQTNTETQILIDRIDKVLEQNAEILDEMDKRILLLEAQNDTATK